MLFWKTTLAIAFHINKKFEIHESIKQKLPNSNNQNYSIQIMARINELIINPFVLFTIFALLPNSLFFPRIFKFLHIFTQIIKIPKFSQQNQNQINSHQLIFTSFPQFHNSPQLIEYRTNNNNSPNPPTTLSTLQTSSQHSSRTPPTALAPFASADRRRECSLPTLRSPHHRWEDHR